MKTKDVLNIQQVLGAVSKCASVRFAEACDRRCAMCNFANEAKKADNALDDVISILERMKSKKPFSPKITMSRAWGMQWGIAKRVAQEAIEVLGLNDGDRDIVQINIRADFVIGSVIAEITERVGDTVRNYGYMSKNVHWEFK